MFYSIFFYPSAPYCLVSEISVFLKNGENKIKHIIGRGGALKGRVFQSRGNPVNNAGITVRGNGLHKTYEVKEDGSYFIDRLCPHQNYTIWISHKIQGISYRFQKGIEIESGECTTLKDFFLDSGKDTWVEGTIKSLIDGKPLPGVKVVLYYYLYDCNHCGQIAFGSVRTDSQGYYAIKNIKPEGQYYIQPSLPMRPFPTDPLTGERVYTNDDVKYNKVKLNFVVKKGEPIKMSFSLEVPSYKVRKQF